MPSRTRRRKSRKRKSCPRRRKAAPRRRPRAACSAGALPSDYEESLTSAGEEETNGEDEDVDSESDEDEESEASDTAMHVAGRTHRKRARRPRRSASSSDEDFELDLKESDDYVSADDGPAIPPSAPALRNNARNAVSHGDVVQAVHHTHASRARRHKRRKHDSSDEDFEMALENEHVNGSMDTAASIRPVTRAMEAGQHSGSCTEGLASVQIEIKNATEDSDAVQNFDLQQARKSALQRKKVSATEKGTASSTRKGKEKVMDQEELMAHSLTEEVAVSSVEGGATVTVVCGICLGETAVAERGKLDCCDHFYCFGCIMEWAKVESRCPMCKQRFATVSKAGISVSKRTRTIRIPVRDQVYIAPEDDVPFEDPYGDVACMECLGTGDEGLLLLCDRCDSAAHTFCVGLGRSVPRGDWYCRDCQALTDENSDSESEAEELVLASDSEEEEEDEDTLLQSIVSSESQLRRQRRVPRVPVSASGPSSQPRRRSQQGGRRRLWRRLVSSRGRRRRVASAPQLSQSARAYLSSVASELNPVSQPLETPHSGSARTVPQQRRLQERIVALRNNWGRLQNGDVQFDAIRTELTAPRQQRVSSSRTSASTSAPVLSVSNGADGDSAKTSPQGDKELKRAWRMMGEARNLCSGTSGGVQHQKSDLSLHTTTSIPSLRHQSSYITEFPIDRAVRYPLMANRNGDIVDTHTNGASSRSLEGSNAGPKVESNESLEVLIRRAKGLSRSPVLTARDVEVMKQEDPFPSTNIADADCGFGRTQDFLRGEITFDSSVQEGTHRTGSTGNFGMINSDMHSFGPTGDQKGYRVDKEGVSAKHINGTKSSFSRPSEGLKIHLTELVKKQTWPVYLAERLDKEQFKRIARAAVHSLLDLFDTNNSSSSFSCSHHEGQGENPVVPCCAKCLDRHVEIAVTTAKEKVVMR